jgi:hypothetical protein
LGLREKLENPLGKGGQEEGGIRKEKRSLPSCPLNKHKNVHN